MRETRRNFRRQRMMREGFGTGAERLSASPRIRSAWARGACRESEERDMSFRPACKIQVQRHLVPRFRDGSPHCYGRSGWRLPHEEFVAADCRICASSSVRRAVQCERASSIAFRASFNSRASTRLAAASNFDIASRSSSRKAAFSMPNPHRSAAPQAELLG